jgi:integrase/recombinase XerC
MLYDYISEFLNYCHTVGFKAKSIETLSFRLIEFNKFLHKKQINDIRLVRYTHLIQFIADYNKPSVHVKKARVWLLRQFFHFLKANTIISKNIALDIPYPKVTKTIPLFLTIDEFNKILSYFAQQGDSLTGLRNLIIIMLLGFLGLRLSTLLRLNLKDVNMQEGLISIRDKGNIARSLCLPQILCLLLTNYLKMLNLNHGPLFLSTQKKRISERTMQDIFKSAMDEIHIDKHLHAHLFRHTAATYLNKVSDPEVTQFVLGHALRLNTMVYTHLNPDIYAEYMKKHPYHNSLEDIHADSHRAIPQRTVGGY